MSDQCSTNPGATHYEGCACHEQGWRNKWECAVEMAAQAEARLEAVQSERDEARETTRQLVEAFDRFGYGASMMHPRLTRAITAARKSIPENPPDMPR
jgi:hypothetical protein